MPRSKRNKQVELAKTKKRGLEWKKHLFEEVRSCIDKYENVFVFSVNDMRNNKMKTVREQWKHSRFFIGKNKIMAMALGRFTEEEYKPNLHKVGQQIKGQRGLLFSNKSVEEVLSWFRSYTEGDYARSGNTATETVQLPAGPLTMFPHNLEPYLRQLGLPTTLERGVIHLVKDHEVCKTGDILTPETAKIIKLLGYEMAEFHFTIDCVWSKDGTFMQLSENIDANVKQNGKQKKMSLLSKVVKENNAAENEEMDIEDESDVENDENESETIEISLSHNTSDVVQSTLNNITTAKSTPKAKSNDFIENEKQEDKSTVDCNVDTSDENKDKRHIVTISEENKNDHHSEELSVKTDNESEKKEADSNSVDTKVKQNGKQKKISLLSKVAKEKNASEHDEMEVEEETSDEEKDEDESEIVEISLSNNTSDVVQSTLNSIITATSTPKAEKGEHFLEELSEKTGNDSEKKEAISNTSRPGVSTKTPRTTKMDNTSKRDSLIKTPDANTSQDSPVFRQLRNRSVKFSRTKKRINK